MKRVLQVLKQCRKELDQLPDDVRGDLADAIARLEEGQMLTLPLSRPMPSIGAGVHEFRLRDRDGIYRVFYVLVATGDIWLLHAFRKKTQKTPPQTIDLVKRRLKEIGR